MSKIDEATDAAIIKKYLELFPKGTRYNGKTIIGLTEQETNDKFKEYYAFLDSLNIPQRSA
jgi:hypothetical protein